MRRRPVGSRCRWRMGRCRMGSLHELGTRGGRLLRRERLNRWNGPLFERRIRGPNGGARGCELALLNRHCQTEFNFAPTFIAHGNTSFTISPTKPLLAISAKARQQPCHLELASLPNPSSSAPFANLSIVAETIWDANDRGRRIAIRDRYFAAE